MKKSIAGIVLFASSALVQSVFGQVAAPIITPGGSSLNPAVNFWKESIIVSVGVASGESKSGSQKVKGESAGTAVSFSGKFSVVGFAASISNVHTDYDDFSTSSNSYTDYYNDYSSQDFQIASGAEFVAVGLDVTNVKSETKYNDNSTSSYSDGESVSNIFGISLQFSELYLGYLSGQNSSKLKTKSSSGQKDYPKLKTNSSGLGIGFLSREKFDIHAEIYLLEESYAKVEDDGSYYSNEESKATGITVEIMADLLNLGLIYQKTSYKEETYKDILDDYDREIFSTVLGFSFTENLNLSYILTTDKYEQKYKSSSEIFTFFDETENVFRINYMFWWKDFEKTKFSNL